jgi:hypothetical protein
MGLPPGVRRKEICHWSDAFPDLSTKRAAVSRARGLDVLQGDCLAAMLGTHCTAEKAIPVKDTNLSNIAWIVANGHGLFHVRREGWIHVPNSLEVNAVAVNSPGFRHRDQQQSKSSRLSGIRGSQPLPDQAVCGAMPDLAMNSGVVGADQEGADGSVQVQPEIVLVLLPACHASGSRIALATVLC